MYIYIHIGFACEIGSQGIWRVCHREIGKTLSQGGSFFFSLRQWWDGFPDHSCGECESTAMDCLFILRRRVQIRGSDIGHEPWAMYFCWIYWMGCPKSPKCFIPKSTQKVRPLRRQPSEDSTRRGSGAGGVQSQHSKRASWWSATNLIGT